ncbi:MAG: histidine--tRNA ligase, partial [Thermoprotei archaeon]
MRFERPRGTRDYLPPETYIRELIVDTAKTVFELYGYSEVVTPAFEHLELLEAKAGPEIREQIYWFKDKAGRLLGLRFDVTTSIARIVANMPQLPKPLRFYYVAPVWRYEEPQRGRLREFWQAGIELIGSPKVDADAEVIALTYRFFEKLGFEKGLDIRINNRKVADALAYNKNVEEELREQFFRAIDKLYKHGEERVVEELRKLGLTSEAIRDTLEFIKLDGRNEEKIEVARDMLKASERGLEGLKELENLVLILKDYYGIPENAIHVDFSIVRGIGY